MSTQDSTSRKRPILIIISIAIVTIAAIGGAWFLRDRGGETDAGPRSAGITVRVENGAATGVAFDGGSSQTAQLVLTLGPGQRDPGSAARIALVDGTPLTEAEIQAVLDRLADLELGSDDVVEFLLPPESLPPPLTGDTIDEPFPPPDAPPAAVDVPGGPLEVLRFSPEGDIPLAPFLSVTFNQPMVALTSLAELAAADVPVILTPDIPGTWRWIGTKTLTFEYDGVVDRFPKATEYTAEVPAGTRSATGGVLAAPVQWRFRTPPPQVVNFFPQNGPQRLDPLFFVAFDQRVDGASVLSTINLNADGRSYSLLPASAAEIDADEAVAALVEHAREGTWLAFKVAEPLPSDTAIAIAIRPGTPSAEGPLTTTSAQRFSIFTYPPLTIVRAECGYYQNECPPLAPFQITFSNPLDAESFNAEMLRIEPALPGAIVDVFGNTLSIRGNTVGRTEYSVTISADVSDIFGQTLGGENVMTFDVGSAEPGLFGPNHVLVTLDPSLSTPVLSVFSINYTQLNVRAYRVTPADWSAYLEFQDNFFRDTNPPSPPGELALDTTIELDSAPDVLTEVAVELGAALGAEKGHLIVVITPPANETRDQYALQAHTIRAWIQVTQIGLDAFVDSTDMVAWATSLSSGVPLEGVTLALSSAAGTPRAEAATLADGTARLKLNGGDILTATLADDVALLPRSYYRWDNQGWAVRANEDELRWYVFDDRALYRPGEDVHLKGWLRQIGMGPGGDVGLVGNALERVTYRVDDPQGNTLVQGEATVNALGGFDFTFTLPENANLGYAQIYLSAANLSSRYGGEFYHSFQIQEFRRPEFEVTARNESTGPYFVGDTATVATTAAYFAGGPLPSAEVNWLVRSTPTTYRPPNWPDFNFGTWSPWWYADSIYGADVFYEEALYADDFFPSFGEGERVQEFSGVTDTAGSHFLAIDIVSMTEPQPFSVMAEATVFDVNRQAWTGATSLLVHPATVYVGLRSERTFVEKGTPLEILAIVADLDGQAVTGRPVEIRAARVEWRIRQGQWVEEEADVQLCSATSTLEPVLCTFETPAGGEYRISATVTDDTGRPNKSEFTRWVSGGSQPTSRQIEQEQLLLIPDKESYQPGDVAQILVQAPFSPAEGLMTVSRSGILFTERFQISEGSTTLAVPIAEENIPNLTVQIDLVGSSPRTGDDGQPLPDLPARPAYATGIIDLRIPPLSRTLSIVAVPRSAALAPGESTDVDVTVTDAEGRPVPDAELAVVVVDEAVLGLSNYQLIDPLAIFYPPRWSGVESYYGRQNIVLANPEVLGDAGADGQSVEGTRVVTETVLESEEMAMDSAAGGAFEAPQANGAPIVIRSDFNPLATFAPSVRTDGAGQATIRISLPDNLTRYRIMVVAVAGGNQFGTAESNLTARLPLMVRPSAPRFLNFGDQLAFPVVVQNQTDAALTVAVVLRTANLTLTGPAGYWVEVPANDRVEVRFPATTAGMGTARFQVAAVLGEFADAASGELPVYTPATTEAFAVYGVVDEGAVAQPIAYPGDVFPQFGGLEISTSSTALQALTDAVLYLSSYPYEGSEQLASRVLGIAALRDVLDAFEADGLPAASALEAAVQRDIEALQRGQNNDGGWPTWTRGFESVPYNSIHVTYALQMAQAKGFAVPQDMIDRARFHLADIESYFPSYYSQTTRQTLSAYALFVRHQLGDSDGAKAAQLFAAAGVEELSLEASAWLWPVLGQGGYGAEAAAIERHIGNRAVETAGAANFTTDYGDEAYLLLHSDRRADAVILHALITQTPGSDLIPKIVNGLLAAQTRGRWLNTQENVFVLLALDRFFNTFEAEEPDFVARIWLGDVYAGSHTFAGRTTATSQTLIPMSYLFAALPEAGSTSDLILDMAGDGRLYYRLGLSYAPNDLNLDPLDMGFVVQRTYEAVDDPDDVYLDDNGVWHVRAGARVRVRVEMVASNRRYHVALVDPLPAGLEIINPTLAVSQSLPPEASAPGARESWWWWGPWYQHQNLRDDRAEAFTTLLWEGSYTYTYVTRATTPGTFVVPPAKAEEMYAPETFGRSGSDILIVE